MQQDTEITMIQYDREVLVNEFAPCSSSLGLGLGQCKSEKKKGLPSPRAEAGQENIETVHEPKPIQTTSSPWGQGRRAMGGPHSP